MPNQKISNLTPKGSALVATDLLEVSVYNGTTYDTRSVTGANVVSGLQPTLVSGTNIKTINSTSLLGSGNIVIGGGGLTIGTTPITSGTVGRVLFEGTGNVVQESAGLTFSPTYSETNITNPSSFSGNQTNFPLLKLSQPLQSFGNSSVIFRAVESSVNNSFSIALYKRSGYNETHFLTGGVGNGANTESAFMRVTGTNTAGYGQGGVFFEKQVSIGFPTGGQGAQLDIKAQGALSTDIALRVRNSADTVDILKVQGDAGIVHNGRFGLNTATSAAIDLFINAGSASSYGIYAIGTYGVAAITARPDTATTNFNFYASACARFGAYKAENSGGGSTVTGIRIGFAADSFNANAFDNIGFKCDIANSGGGGSIALDIVNGNFRFGTGTGTKIATATTQKIGFWNATPIVQPTTAVAAATVVSGTGGTVKHDDTFDGYTLQQIVKALRNTGLLA